MVQLIITVLTFRIFYFKITPLYELLKSDTKFSWLDIDRDFAPEINKNSIHNHIMLAYFDLTLPKILATDTSFYDIDEVISHH